MLGPCALATLARARRGRKNEMRLAAPHCGQIAAGDNQPLAPCARNECALRARSPRQLRVTAKRYVKPRAGGPMSNESDKKAIRQGAIAGICGAIISSFPPVLGMIIAGPSWSILQALAEEIIMVLFAVFFWLSSSSLTALLPVIVVTFFLIRGTIACFSLYNSSEAKKVGPQG